MTMVTQMTQESFLHAARDPGLPQKEREGLAVAIGDGAAVDCAPVPGYARRHMHSYQLREVAVRQNAVPIVVI
jgi:hypothetical protein